ncbi:MAG: Uxx-star family glutaredoxin-like (seleno)protein [Candidatus Acidiferrales bacterium]
MAKLSLFGSSACPHTREMREWLEWRKADFEEYDVDVDGAAFARMRALTDGQCTVPVLVEGDKVVQIGWQGRGCVVAQAPGPRK